MDSNVLIKDEQQNTGIQMPVQQQEQKPVMQKEDKHQREQRIRQEQKSLTEEQKEQIRQKEVYIHSLMSREEILQGKKKAFHSIGGVSSAIQKVMGQENVYGNVMQTMTSEDEIQRTKGLHHSRGTQLVKNGNYVLKFNLTGTGFSEWRREQNGFDGKFRKEEKRLEKHLKDAKTEEEKERLRAEFAEKEKEVEAEYGKSEEDRKYVRKKQSDHKTTYNISSVPGLRNKGDYNIEHVSDYVREYGLQYLEPIFLQWDDLGAAGPDIHILLSGHSRGGVAAGKGALMLKKWISDNYPQYIHSVKFELIQYDPVAGMGSNSGTNEELDLNGSEEELSKEEMEALGESAETTVIYSFHSNHSTGFSPQAVKGAKRVILTPFRHSMGQDGLDESQIGVGNQTEKAHRLAYTDAKDGEVYRGSGLSELQEGIYILDENNILVQIPDYKSFEKIMDKVLKWKFWQWSRYGVIKDVVQTWFLGKTQEQESNVEALKKEEASASREEELSGSHEEISASQAEVELHRQLRTRASELSEHRKDYFLWSNQDSVEMVNIREAITKLNAFFERSVDQKGFKEQFQILRKRYTDLQTACAVYIAKKRPKSPTGKTRKRMVKELNELCSRELGLLENTNIDLTEYEKKGIEIRKWDDLLLNLRCIRLDRSKMTDNRLQVNNTVYHFQQENDLLEEKNTVRKEVAARKLSEMLGVSDLFAQIGLVQVQDQQKPESAPVLGVLKQEVEGARLMDVLSQAEQEGDVTVSYSQEAIRQLSTMQLMDVLMGNVERSKQHYLVQVKKETTNGKKSWVITGVTADRNADCFSKRSYDEIKKGKKHLGAIENDQNRLMLPAVDRVFFYRLCCMKPEWIDLQLRHLLTEEERSSLKERLAQLQNRLKQAEEGHKEKKEGFLYTRGEWAGAVARMANVAKDGTRTYLKPELLQHWKAKELNLNEGLEQGLFLPKTKQQRNPQQAYLTEAYEQDFVQNKLLEQKWEKADRDFVTAMKAVHTYMKKVEKAGVPSTSLLAKTLTTLTECEQQERNRMDETSAGYADMEQEQKAGWLEKWNQKLELLGKYRMILSLEKEAQDGSLQNKGQDGNIQQSDVIAPDVVTVNEEEENRCLELSSRVENRKLVFKDVSDQPLFKQEPSVEDIKQGYLGDCYALSAIADYVAQEPQSIRNIMKDNGDGTVTVRLFQSCQIRDISLVNKETVQFLSNSKAVGMKGGEPDDQELILRWLHVETMARMEGNEKLKQKCTALMSDVDKYETQEITEQKKKIAEIKEQVQQNADYQKLKSEVERKTQECQARIDELNNQVIQLMAFAEAHPENPEAKLDAEAKGMELSEKIGEIGQERQGYFKQLEDFAQALTGDEFLSIEKEVNRIKNQSYQWKPGALNLANFEMAKKLAGELARSADFAPIVAALREGYRKEKERSGNEAPDIANIFKAVKDRYAGMTKEQFDKVTEVVKAAERSLKADGKRKMYITVRKTVPQFEGGDIFAKESLWVQILEKALATAGLKQVKGYNIVNDRYDDETIQKAYQEALEIGRKGSKKKGPYTKEEKEKAREFIQKSYVFFGNGGLSSDVLNQLGEEEYEKVDTGLVDPLRLKEFGGRLSSWQPAPEEGTTEEEKELQNFLAGHMEQVLMEKVGKQYRFQIREGVEEEEFSLRGVTQEDLLEQLPKIKGELKFLYEREKNGQMMDQELFERSYGLITQSLKQYLEREARGFFNRPFSGKYTRHAQKIFAAVKGEIDKGHYVSAGTRSYTPKKLDDSGLNGESRVLGIAECHAYSIIGYTQQDGHMYFKLRNPWGRMSRGYTEYMDENNNIQYEAHENKEEDGGIFYMELNDFLGRVDDIYIQKGVLE